MLILIMTYNRYKIINKMTDKDCSHTTFDIYNCCNRCGKVVIRTKSDGTQYGDMKRVCNSRGNTETFSNSIRVLNIPDDVKEMAITIHKKMGSPVHRCGPRDRMIFACIYYAYNELNIPYVATDIAKMCGIKKKNMSEALTEYSEFKSGYRPVVRPYDYNRKTYLFGMNLGLSQHSINGICEILSIIRTSNDPILRSRKPYAIVAGAIKFYAKIHGICLPSNKLRSIVGLTDATVSEVEKDIARIYNKQ